MTSVQSMAIYILVQYYYLSVGDSMIKIEITTVFGYNSRANNSTHWLALLQWRSYRDCCGEGQDIIIVSSIE